MNHSAPPWPLERSTSTATEARAVSSSRRFVDPTTCERDDAAAEQEFMNAIQAYKKASGRMFPTWSEVLEVLLSLGYQKAAGKGSARRTRPVHDTPRSRLASASANSPQ
jgi:hypothetical protein